MKKLLALIGLALALSGCGWLGRAAQVTSEETDPRVMLNRYEWFKDAAAQLDAKLASIEVYKAKFKDLEGEYKGVPRTKWAREDREQWSQWKSEVAGVIGSYNTLAGQYNAAMAKINYAYTNVGQLPKGADKPLPREFKSYVMD